MIVTIVAKTRQGGGACVGAITADGRSVRLIASDAGFNEHANLEYEVGQRWEIEADAPEEVIPPHIENVVVRRKRPLPSEDNLAGLIERHMPAIVGGPELLYNGLLQTSSAGALYISLRGGLPDHSTAFWRPDRPLIRDTSGKRIHYRYPTAEGGQMLVFVGFQEPPEEIPAGTLLRVSLAHWWRAEDQPEQEVRCHVQLSGWFGLPGEVVPIVATPRTQDDTTPTLNDARLTLKRVFGYDTFRPLQESIIAGVLAGRDALAVMPTGSGKSLCYQLPALLFPGLTVVVSPLISLMEDQVMQLRELGVSAAYLNSTLSYSDYVAISHRIAAGKIKLLYTAPETLLRPETLVMLDNCRVDCLTIDEAHCISEWGHDFRPEYRQLAAVRRRFANAVCLAVTATATSRVRDDIRASLGVSDAATFISSFDRENLFLAVEQRADGLGQTLAFLEDHRGESGIIYCMTRRQVDVLAEQLTARGWNALPYHAGLDTNTRQAHQQRFTYDEAFIIVATIAFGMGINKSNVRFVLHYDLPKDLESYYQQIGRAGRDGLRADCLLLFSAQDVFTINRLIEGGAPDQRPGATARLQAMLAYVETDECRRRPLLAYFGERRDEPACHYCDNCEAGSREKTDLTIAAQKFLSCVKRTGEVFGAGHIINVLRGSRAEAVLSRGHDRLSTYGIGGEYSRKEWQQLARQFVQKGLLVQDMEHGSLKLTTAGWAVMRGEPFHGSPPAAERRTARAVGPVDYDAELFELLRARRAELAKAAGVPPYVIFPDTALAGMAHYYPQSASSLLEIQGVGEIKLERYGDAFLNDIRDYCAARGLADRTGAAGAPGLPEAARSRKAGSRATTARRDEVLALYNGGRGVGEIAAIFDVKLSTVVNYLWEAVREGTIIAATPLLAECELTASEQARVKAALGELGTERLRPIYDALNETVSYEQLHLLRLHYVAAALEQAAPPVGD